MEHTAALPTPQRLQRASGEVRLAFQRRDGATVLRDLYQVGCCKVRFPRVEAGQDKQAVLLNTAGGLTDGDSVATAITWDAGTTATITSQAAERIYRSRQAPARIDTVLNAGPGATAFWLPQETIMFNHARLHRTTTVTLDATSRFLGLESLVFGRAAMGETVQEGAIADRWRIQTAGRLVYADNFAVDGAIAEMLARPAIANGAMALTTVLYAGADAASHLEPVRAVLGKLRGVSAGATCRGGVLIVRMLANVAARLRKAIIVLIGMMRLSLLHGEAKRGLKPGLMPRVWAC